MKNWQFYMVMAGLLQIDYRLDKSGLTLTLAWLAVVASICFLWKDTR